MNTDIQVQYWCLIWDRSHNRKGFQERAASKFPTPHQQEQQEQNEPPKLFIIQDGADMGYRFLLKKAGELTKERVDEITYKKSDGTVVVVRDDESLGYVKRLEQAKRLEGGALRETVLTIRTTSFIETLLLLVFGLFLAGALYFGSLRFYSNYML